jgi:hypothetical protein
MSEDLASGAGKRLPSPVLVVLPSPAGAADTSRAADWVRRLEQGRVDAVVTPGGRRLVQRALVAVRPEAAVALDPAGARLLTELAPWLPLLH